MDSLSSPRERIAHAFTAVQRRVAVASAFLLLAHASLGALFGTLLAAIGDGGPWALSVLAALGAAGAAAWTSARLPDVAAGRLIEGRFPECRNILITADEVLAGTLEIDDTAAERVFTRAAETLGRIDTSRVVTLGARVVLSLAIVTASAIGIALIWRNALSTQH